MKPVDLANVSEAIVQIDASYRQELDRLRIQMKELRKELDAAYVLSANLQKQLDQWKTWARDIPAF